MLYTVCTSSGAGGCYFQGTWLNTVLYYCVLPPAGITKAEAPIHPLPTRNERRMEALSTALPHLETLQLDLSTRAGGWHLPLSWQMTIPKTIQTDVLPC